MVYFEGMSVDHHTLPVDTIAKGSHIFLDVRRRFLRITKAIPHATALAVVQCEEYELRDTDAALLLFSNLQENSQRFRSVKIV